MIKAILVLLLMTANSYAALPKDINSREYNKFVETAGGDVAVRATMAAGSKITNVSTVSFQSFYNNGIAATGTTTINWNNGNYQSVIMGTGSGLTIAFTAPTSNVGSLTLKMKQDSGGSRIVSTWPTIKWRGGSAPTLTTTANKTDILKCIYDGSEYFCDTSLNY